ncbi:MAG: BMP family ABC transporter substrate-binding protein, partial [Phototrophicaceae bacterium]
MKLFLRFCACSLLFLVASACVSRDANLQTPIAAPQDAATTRTPRIMMVVTNGELLDSGYNQGIHEGLETVSARLGATVETANLIQPETRQSQLEALAVEGYAVIVVPFGASTELIAVASAHPEVHFVGVDHFQAEPMPNLTGIVFPTDKAGYLAGVLAAHLSQSNIVAGIYGPQGVADVQAFAVGYEHGAQSVNPAITVLTYFHPGSPSVGFSDMLWGQARADEAFAGGADVVFTAAGETGTAALTAYADHANEGVYCIGVDTDQWQTVPDARPCLVTSAIKGVPQALDQVIEQVLAGAPPAGNFIGPVGLAPFHDFDSTLSASLKAELAQTQTDLLNGTIATGYCNPSQDSNCAG